MLIISIINDEKAVLESFGVRNVKIIYVKPEDIIFFDPDAFIISKKLINLEDYDELYLFTGLDGYYIKIATTEDNYIFALDGCFY